MYNFNNKVVLVTGAATGIGAEIVRAFLDKGAKHVAILDIKTDFGTTLEQELNSKYGDGTVKFIKCDVTKDLDAAFEETVKIFGYIDVVINNAGIMNDDPNVYEREILINVTALITSSLKAYNMMHLQKGGKGGTIINISSELALQQKYTLSVYSATKSAVLQFSNCLGMNPNYDRSGVRVIAICFGITDTNLIRGKIGVVDTALDADIAASVEAAAPQKSDVAARELTEAYEKGASGSTWLIRDGNPAEDITENVKKAYEILAMGVS